MFGREHGPTPEEMGLKKEGERVKVMGRDLKQGDIFIVPNDAYGGNALDGGLAPELGYKKVFGGREAKIYLPLKVTSDRDINVELEHPTGGIGRSILIQADYEYEKVI